MFVATTITTRNHTNMKHSSKIKKEGDWKKQKKINICMRNKHVNPNLVFWNTNTYSKV